MLDDKIVLITGGGSGIGRGVAEAVAQAGARVAAADIDLVGATDTSELLGGAERCMAVELDVTDAESIQSAVDQVVESWGRVDGWVNSAGVIKMDAALDVTPADWHLQFDVNVRGLFLGCQAAARQMIAQGGGGAIVNIASNAGKVGYPKMAAYNASKAAVISLTRSLAEEWADQRINVNAVCPGGVDTPMLSNCAEWITSKSGGDAKELLAEMTPRQLGRHVQPVEVGRLAAFLLSDRAELIRGQSISADGGDTPY